MDFSSKPPAEAGGPAQCNVPSLPLRAFWRGGFVFVVLAAVCAGGGCRRDGRVSVSGVVRFADGSPVPRGIVRFEGETRSGYAKIQPDGRYMIEAGGGTRGIRPGVYAVIVDSTADAPVWNEATKTYSQSKGLVDDRFAWPATSGLSCEVKGATVFDIVVEPPAK